MVERPGGGSDNFAMLGGNAGEQDSRAEQGRGPYAEDWIVSQQRYHQGLSQYSIRNMQVSMIEEVRAPVYAPGSLLLQQLGQLLHGLGGFGPAAASG